MHRYRRAAHRAPGQVSTGRTGDPVGRVSGSGKGEVVRGESTLFLSAGPVIPTVHSGVAVREVDDPVPTPAAVTMVSAPMTGMPGPASHPGDQHSVAASASATPNDSAEAKRDSGSAVSPRITTAARCSGMVGAISDSGVGGSNACLNSMPMASPVGGNGSTPESSS